MVIRFVSQSIYLPEFLSHNGRNITGCGKPIFRIFHPLLKIAGLSF
jgi:hypothetical protein